jgi:hypothetical protein
MAQILEPSQRTPELPTNHNTADHIERYLQTDGHRTWGFVIYRCTYDDDDDDEWNEFMERLRYRIRQTLANSVRDSGYRYLKVNPKTFICP